ncbi:MAG: N-acetylglucosamine-6-phosphate deacetylase [Anaerolineae bacterium]|nr:N-acetylglucosamine-6-phosphate deacetylase [Anaerolineae bacterium]
MLYIKNAQILTPSQVIEGGALLVQEGKIAALGPVEQVRCLDGAAVIDAEGMTLTPGFVDVQINGGFGLDFTADPSTIWAVAGQLPRYGVTAFLPTVITSPLDNITRAQQIVLDRPPDFRGAKPLGLHVEGPFLNPQKKGAHNPDYLRKPDIDAVRDWTPEYGVRLVTLAPELPGALELIETLVSRGVVVSSGHTMATYDQAQAGFDAGTRYGTHLFNAQPPLHHREPGLIGALFTDGRPIVGMIVDGIHSHPSIVDMVWRLLGHRLSLVTDAMEAMGMPPGTYKLGDLQVIVDETSARLADGTLAGSILTLDAALRNLMCFTGCSFQDALPAVTTVPATLLDLDSHCGQLAPGCAADLVLLDGEYRVVKTIIDGKIVYDRVTDPNMSPLKKLNAKSQGFD